MTPQSPKACLCCCHTHDLGDRLHGPLDDCPCTLQTPKAASSAGDGHSPMTPEERARYIVDRCPELWTMETRDYIAEQIKLAMREAFKAGIDSTQDTYFGVKLKEAYEKGHLDGQVAMREEAMSICDKAFDDTGETICQWIEEKIRTLQLAHPHAPEEGNEND